MTGFNEGKILVDGNTAGALGALAGGLSLASWYPITPSSSLAESIEKYAPALRTDPETGKSTVAVIQAEDELAAMGMVVGAGWTGARAMTCTSGPGIRPDGRVRRTVLLCRGAGRDLGHSADGAEHRPADPHFAGRYTRRLLPEPWRYQTRGSLPRHPVECFEFGRVAFDLAEELQTLVLVLSDLDLGMNSHISEPFEYSDAPFKRGKVLSAEDLEERQGSWARYMDVDGDGVTYRTLPGTKHNMAAYFTRGTGHNEYGYYSERPEDWEQNLERLKRKFETARNLVPLPILDEAEEAQIGIVSLGSNHDGVEEARARLSAAGVTTSYLRLRALPIDSKVRSFIDRYATILVIESNSDGQLTRF